jgi:predicted RNA-binding protein with RPS1 domain
VFKVSDYGAHVQLPNGMPALVHISQWAHHRVRDIHEVAAEGMEIDVLCKVGLSENFEILKSRKLKLDNTAGRSLYSAMMCATEMCLILSHDVRH